ncbi:hypothetical protein LK996_03625 [Lysobacter sp. A6]|uniref:Uncharacterized protein n=1 Tax=Noviluteimonas lactosilytica TaxID=2888523 RepID=A0ABS8JEX9_9GAMM|nr:hypothetical protein [Lysobacter lactosilyticus]MCC8362163.1 hypothetical protein [Lysobacter lactosilyticus]
MKKQVLLLALAATLGAAPAHAIHINDHAFVANGGDMSNVQGTYTSAFNKLHTASQASRFDAVGQIGSCTATWLGVEGEYAWVLTSASCAFNKTPHLTAAVPGALAFRNASMGYPVAVGGPGTMSFVHPNFYALPAGTSQHGANLALMRLKISDKKNAPLRGPLLNDVHAESNLPVSFVSYGAIGVNSEKILNAPTRRYWAQSFIDGAADAGNALFQGFKAGSSTHWAQLQPTDRGSAWWQQHNGHWQVVAMSSGSVAGHPKGVRMSRYASWINDLFPAARLVSEGNASVFDDAEVTNSNRFDLRYTRPVSFFASEGQPDVIVSGSIADPGSVITVPVTNLETGVTRSVALTPSRHSYQSSQTLIVEFIDANNTALPPGVWKGRVSLDVVTPAGTHPTAKLDLDIAVVGAPQEGFDYRSKNLATNVGVYFSVPTQATASGPTSGFRNTKLGHTIITVQGRNAITQQPTELKLRAQRVRGGSCAPVEMNNAMPCGTDQSSVLNIWFDPIDNPSLAYDTRYAAKFNVQARSFGNSTVNQTFPVSVDVNLML